MVTAGLSIKLRCTSWQQLSTIYKRDLSRGSMFLKASTPPPIGTLVRIDLTLPSDTVIALTGMVEKHVNDPQRGAGVELKLAPIAPNSIWLIESALAAEVKVRGSSQSETTGGAFASQPVATITEGEDVAAAEQELIRALHSEAESLKKLNPFLVLGLGYEAADAEVRAAFGELTKRYHPDRYARYQSKELRQLAAEIFILIRDAYRKLGDEASRSQVLNQLGRTPAPRAVPGPRAASPPPLPPRAVPPPIPNRVAQVPAKRPTEEQPVLRKMTSEVPVVAPPKTTGEVPVVARTPAGGVPIQPSRTPAGGIPIPAPPSRTPGGGVPVVRAPTGAVPVVADRNRTPPGGVPIVAPTPRRTPVGGIPIIPDGNRTPPGGVPIQPSEVVTVRNKPDAPPDTAVTTRAKSGGEAPVVREASKAPTKQPEPMVPASTERRPLLHTPPPVLTEAQDAGALEELLDAGRFDEALSGYKVMSKRFPADRSFRAGIELCEGLRALTTRDRLEAAQRFEAALEIDPSNERAARELAEMRRQATNERKGLLSRLMGKKET